MSSQQTAPANGAEAKALATQAGTVARQEFGADQLAVQAETASSAVAAQAQAVVQARYVMAMRYPRDIDDVRIRLLKECKRTGFAEVARYAKPMGKSTVNGFSIRFAEAAARCMKNILCEVATIWDDPHKRIVRVSVTDLESNLTYPKDVLVEKTVERKHLKAGQTALATRLNSYNEPVYILPATDDEVLTKENNLVSKALRNSILRLLPGDILDEAEAEINATLRSKAEQDPDAERKKITDAFASVGVMPSDLKHYLGHELSTATPAELVKLRGVFQALKGGESNWQEVVGTQTADVPPPKPGVDGVKEKLKAEASTKAPAPAAPEAAAQACQHPTVPASRLAGVPKGKSVVCEMCAAELPGTLELPPMEREPGDDADDAPKAGKPRQTKLTE